MKKNTPYLIMTMIVGLSLCSISLVAQDLGCGAAEMNKDLPLKDFQFINNVNSLDKDGGTWSSSDGYRADGTCDHDCNIAPFDNAPPSAACDGGNYQIPVKIWIMTDDNGSNQSVTAAEAAEQIADANAYHACNGIPIELVQVAGSPGIIASTDFNDFRNPAVAGDASDDGDVGAAFADVGAVNVYIPKTLNGGGCNGYAYLPGGPDRILMASNCFAPVADPCTNTQLAIVFIHEFGHYLGLLHTHGDYVPGNYPDESTDPTTPATPFSGTVSQELVDGTNGCSTGDFVHDTPADLGISHSEALNNAISNPVGGCASGGGCASNFTCTDANAATYMPSLDNIMNYNNSSGCRQEYTDCQKAKMVDALVCSRTNLCGKVVTDFFASADVSLREKTICVGDAVPSFTAIDACKNWYAYAGGTRGALIYTGDNFNPQTEAAASSASANTYEYWVNDANAYNSECGQAVKLTIINETADATPALVNLTGNTTTTLSAPDPNLTTDQIIGWWVRSGTAVSNATFADQAALDAGLATATNGGTVMDNPDNIFASNTGSPATDYDLVMNCNDLDPGVSYYATPFISTSTAGIADATCNPTSGSFTVSFGGGQEGQLAVIASGDVTCSPASPPNSPTFTLTLTIANYTGAGNLLMNIRDNPVSETLIAQSLPGNGVYTYTNASFVAGYDPGVRGFNVVALESGTASAATMTLDLDLDITYPGTPAIAFPDVDYTPCIFGNAITINCSALLPVELVSFRGEQNGDHIDLLWNTANEQNNDFFSLEKADDNGIFREIAVIKGAGTTEENQYYSEIDRRPNAGQNLYRLKQTDFDGTTTTSAVVAVHFKADEIVDFFPNPVKGGAFTLQYQTEKNAGQAQLEIFALNGQSLHRQTLAVELGINRYEINVNDLAKGVYLARIINGSSVHTFKLTNVE